MTQATKKLLDGMIIRRSGAAWREHVVAGSVDSRDSDVPLVWSRTWLRRRLRSQLLTYPSK